MPLHSTDSLRRQSVCPIFLGTQISERPYRQCKKLVCVGLQAVQPDPEEADHAEGAGQRPHLCGHRRQTAGTRQ